MKKAGCIFEYEAQRNDDLRQTYKRIIASVTHISVHEILHRVVNSPSRRFWVSEERAAIVLSRMMRGDDLRNMRPMKREMFREIYRRAVDLMSKCPYMTISDLAFTIVHQQAPKFYITPGSCKVILSKIRRKWYERRKRK